MELPVKLSNPEEHPFVRRPNRTLLILAVPIFFSLVAEPVTGLVDTGFIARLGAAPLAAMGVGTAALSSIFWVLNFIAIGTQTNVAQSYGEQKEEKASRLTSLALLISAAAGVLLIVIGWMLAPWAASMLGASDAVLEQAVTYMRIRLFGGPAVVLMLTSFGALRGMLDMGTPLWIALAVNGLNILLDALLIPGWGPFPAWGVAGAATASTAAQSAGALSAVLVVVRKLGWTRKLRLVEAGQLMRSGGDLFIRSGSLTFFLLFATRAATQAGVESGAAHQAIRQVWFFTVLGLDALALAAQSLVGYFTGSDWIEQARRVAGYVCAWGMVMGLIISSAMWLGRQAAADLLVPVSAHGVFILPWLAAAFIQPINSLAFVTDGIHWGTSDFAYLRNAMLIATVVGSALLFLVEISAADALLWIWLATAAWIFIRAIFGIVRIWPGLGKAPLGY